MKCAVGRPPVDPLERFWAKVEKTATCWIWQGTILSNGYGQFWGVGSHIASHRYAYELLVGPIPAGRHLHHICENRACVNPAHLQPVTVKEHVGLHGAGRQTHCKNGHEFTPENTRQSGIQRVCRTCQRKWQREFRARQKNAFQEGVAA